MLKKRIMKSNCLEMIKPERIHQIMFSGTTLKDLIIKYRKLTLLIGHTVLDKGPISVSSSSKKYVWLE